MTKLKTPVIEVPVIEVAETPTVEATPVVEAPVRTQAKNGTRSTAVFANQLTSLNRRTEKDPHFFGGVKIDGLWYQTATWINVTKGVQNLSTAYTLMTEEQAAKAEEREVKFQAERLARANPLSAPPVTNPLEVDGDVPPPF